MGLKLKFSSLFVLTFLLVFFQNCSQLKFSEIQDSFSKKTDNGSVFDGKPTYFLTQPGFTCEGLPAPVAIIKIKESGPHITYNQNDHCEAIKDQPLSLSEIDHFNFDPQYIGYRDGIYEKYTSSPDLSSETFNEAWCQSTETDVPLTAALKFDSQTKTASSQIFYSLEGVSYQSDSFQVDRQLNDVSAIYSSPDFNLTVDRSLPAPEKWWYFTGYLKTKKVPAAWEGRVLCRMATSRLLAHVQKVYPKNADWNSYVRIVDTTKDIWSQPDHPCASASSWKQCTHGGDKLAVATDLKTCLGASAQDLLDAFNWVCEEHSEGVVFKSNRLKIGRGLSDLVTEHGWKPNRVQVTQAGRVRFESMPLGWWKNPVFTPPTQAAGVPVQLNTPKAIYVFENDRVVSGLQVVEDSVAIVVKPGARLRGEATMPPNCNLTGFHFAASDGTLPPTHCLVTNEGRNFVWIEGLFDSAGSNSRAGINLNNANFTRLHQVKSLNANGGFGVYQDRIQGSIVSDMEAIGNRFGFLSQNSSGNLISNSNFSSNISTGLSFEAWDNNNTMMNSQATQNGLRGFVFNSAKDLILISNRSLNNGVSGFELSGFTDNAVFESTVSVGDKFAIDINRASHVSLRPNRFINSTLAATSVGVRVLQGTGVNKEIFEENLYSGSSSLCTVYTTSGPNSTSCPGSGLPGSEVFSQTNTRLSVLNGCRYDDKTEIVNCSNGLSLPARCQVEESKANPISFEPKANQRPTCLIPSVFK